VRRGTDLERVCSFYYEAMVLNDNTVRLEGIIIDVPPEPRKRSYAGERIELRHLLDGTSRLYLRDTVIATAAGTSARRAACAPASPSAPSRRRLGGENSTRPTGSFRFPHRNDSVTNLMPGEDIFAEQ